MNCGIYQIKNLKTNKVYIGSSENLEKRLKDHLKELKAGRHANKKLQNSWKKHGEENFSFDVILLCSEEDLISNEQMFIDNCSLEKMYNICLIAGSTKGRRHSDEAKRKIGLFSRGNKYCLGRTLSVEHREKITLALLSRGPMKEETKRKISETKKGRKNSEEHNKKVSIGLKKFFNKQKESSPAKEKRIGKKWTQEQKERHSQIMKSPEVVSKLKTRPKRVTSEETKKKQRESQAIRFKREKENGQTKINSESTRQKIKDKLNSPETKALLLQRWAERKQKQQNTKDK